MRVMPHRWAKSSTQPKALMKFSVRHRRPSTHGASSLPKNARRTNFFGRWILISLNCWTAWRLRAQESTSKSITILLTSANSRNVCHRFLYVPAWPIWMMRSTITIFTICLCRWAWRSIRRRIISCRRNWQSTSTWRITRETAWPSKDVKKAFAALWASTSSSAWKARWLLSAWRLTVLKSWLTIRLGR